MTTPVGLGPRVMPLTRPAAKPVERPAPAVAVAPSQGQRISQGVGAVAGGAAGGFTGFVLGAVALSQFLPGWARPVGTIASVAVGAALGLKGGAEVAGGAHQLVKGEAKAPKAAAVVGGVAGAATGLASGALMAFALGMGMSPLAPLALPVWAVTTVAFTGAGAWAGRKLSGG